MANSVDSYINAQPESAMSLGDYWSDVYGGYESINSMGNKFMNAFTGLTSDARDKYQAYLNNLNNRNEYIATQSARAWEKYLDDTKIQRLVKDYEKAGLNPALALFEGSIAGSPGSSSSVKASYSAKSREEKEKKGNLSGLALLLMAIGKVAAALL